MEINDAPEDYHAVKATTLCGGCAFWKKGKCKVIEDTNIRCCASERKDKVIVIFKRNQK